MSTVVIKKKPKCIYLSSLILKECRRVGIHQSTVYRWVGDRRSHFLLTDALRSGRTEESGRVFLMCDQEQHLDLLRGRSQTFQTASFYDGNLNVSSQRSCSSKTKNVFKSKVKPKWILKIWNSELWTAFSFLPSCIDRNSGGLWGSLLLQTSWSERIPRVFLPLHEA